MWEALAVILLLESLGLLDIVILVNLQTSEPMVSVTLLIPLAVILMPLVVLLIPGSVMIKMVLLLGELNFPLLL